MEHSSPRHPHGHPSSPGLSPLGEVFHDHSPHKQNLILGTCYFTFLPGFSSSHLLVDLCVFYLHQNVSSMGTGPLLLTVVFAAPIIIVGA